MAKFSQAELTHHDILRLDKTHFIVFSCHVFATEYIQALVHQS